MSLDKKRVAAVALKLIVTFATVALHALYLTLRLTTRLLRDPRRRKWVLLLGVILLLLAVCRARNTASPTPTTASGSATSAAARQAAAYKAYQDYQYVKYTGPLSGPMYPSTKW